MTKRNQVPDLTGVRRLGGSFRDPAGFLFFENDIPLRQVNPVYADNFKLLTGSGLYQELSDAGQLISHEIVPEHKGLDGKAWCVLRPKWLSFVSYPYEWSFFQLQQAAVLTLDINLKAMAKGMILKDASAWNIQFDGCRPVLVDTLSLERYDKSKPWVAYRQFCQHFLNPLLLAAYCDATVLQEFIFRREGFSAAYAASRLPWRTRLNLGILMHVHLNKRLSVNTSGSDPAATFSFEKLERVLLHLRGMVASLKPRASKTTWEDYYSGSISGEGYLNEKAAVVEELIQLTNGITATDLGCNNGYFSRMLQQAGYRVIAIDSDVQAIDQLARANHQSPVNSLLTIVADISNPSPALGWRNSEDKQLIDRLEADTCLSLALWHHLYFQYNIPLADIAAFTASICRQFLIVEYVPVDDKKTQIISRGKEQLIPGYSREAFEKAVSVFFRIIEIRMLSEEKRIIYLLKRNT
ncbi:class I SAM-dependent methyltransferase [Flavihumibacter petaseus]|uniref:Tellurite resistance methyltransferase TehB-like domain-containing protein n=1 Tax=Flavihumibacter petaseus NBRC 106054 TaxID=1220578 RepID=A0A0E9N1A4_9BACT|nr:class I SAM-dependent methyltransferase [Flavihumibacter petaseus]GAO43416.1 hypothetical protein FPE01S_02_05210 [Flavihumibacter petaseus NBRC 106054]